MDNFYLYEWLDPRPHKNNECFYVGIGTGNRVYSRKRNKHFNAKLKKIEDSGFHPTAHIVVLNLSRSDAIRLEIEKIKEYGRADLGIGSLTNKTNGGDGGNTVGGRTKENSDHIRKMAEKIKGLNNPNYGMKWTAAQKRQMTNSKRKTELNIVILAAGLASRLAPLTNYLPKCLINAGKQTVLVEQIRFWEQYTDKFTVVVHSKYKELVQSYCSLYFKDISIEIKTIDVALGSAHSIYNTCEHLFNKDVIFNWCDVSIEEFSHSSKWNSNEVSILVNNSGGNRYNFNKSLYQVDDNSGNVIGIYRVKNFKEFCFEDGSDFVECLSQFGKLGAVTIKKYKDIGDKPKLFEVLKSADEGREFNRVNIMETLVHKTPLNEQGRGLIRKEVSWYKEVFGSGLGVNVPTVYPSLSHNELIMERVDGVSIFKLFSEASKEDQAAILKGVFDNFNALHSKKTETFVSIVQRDVRKEAFTKLISRYDEIEAVIQAFGKNITKVNGIEISNDPRHIIHQLYNEIADCYDCTNEYSLIHGDLQMSNSMVNPKTLKVTFIDPRGYFGDTLNYGLADYDFAKFLYSMSGYDLFNYSTSFHLTNITDTEIEFEIPRPKVYEFPEFTRVQWLWLAVCWIGLAQYIKNNPIKSVAAHYHGLALATKFLNKDYTL